MLESSIDEEFGRLGDTVYADHAGAALYSEKQLAHIFQQLSRSTLGNPHSMHTDTHQGKDAESKSRQLTLDMCNASSMEYDCVFTSGATGAMQLVGDCFPWSRDSKFAYSRDNHTSVLGIREQAKRSGASIQCIDTRLLGDKIRRGSDGARSSGPRTHNLFAYPLESNFDGGRYEESITSEVQAGFSSEPFRGHMPLPGVASALPKEEMSRGEAGSTAEHFQRLQQPNAKDCTEQDGQQATENQAWWVLLDAAKACATKPPDLSLHKPDFVALSFYKIFGYPTGLGALLIHKDVQAYMRRGYFGGGTVEACSADTDFVRRRSGPAGLEHGTNSFLGIASLPHGFALIQRLGGFKAIHAHACSLARLLALSLASLTHHNGQSACLLYQNPRVKGGLNGHSNWSTVTVNFLRSDGSYVGYREVERLAHLNGIRLRGGCFCNPGACAAHLSLSDKEIMDHHEAGHVCWDDHDIMDGKPTGAIRFSFGLASARRDVDRILQFATSHFVESPPAKLLSPEQSATASYPMIKAIWVYPIKSCKGVRMRRWWMGENGLLYDREWALVDASGSVMTLKNYPQLATISCSIDLDSGLLEVSAPNIQQKLLLSLTAKSSSGGQPADVKAPTNGRTIHLCGESCTGMQVKELWSERDSLQPNEWMSQATGVPCSLVQQQSGMRNMTGRPVNGRPTNPPKPSTLGFANEAQLLLINEASLQDLNDKLQAYPEASKKSPPVTPEMFRPNILVTGCRPFEEDKWQTLAVGSMRLSRSDLCARCEVICVDQQRGIRGGSEPLKTLAQYRRSRGRINFGILLQTFPVNSTAVVPPVLNVGTPVEVLE